ncbi:MAG TPA: metallophosphoesterase family protein [Chondromyces sp.]|nr:metallophosphoesterase family protein [Chondromyces sp.]
MRIIVVADTHFPKRGKKLPEKLIDGLKKADLIIHAGDWLIKEVYDELSTYTQVKGVVGNQDDKEMAFLPEKQLIEAEGWKIGVVHGHGDKSTTEKRALAAFSDEKVDCIIFGHSHIPYLKYEKGILLFNPGSATDKRRVPYYSYGVLTLDEEGIHAEHRFYKDK